MHFLKFGRNIPGRRRLHRSALVATVAAIVGIAFAAFGVASASTQTVMWGGQGSDLLPCADGGHWVLTGQGIDSAVLHVGSWTGAMTQNGDGSFSADSVGALAANIDESTVFAVYTGNTPPSDHILALSSCVSVSTTPSAETPTPTSTSTATPTATPTSASTATPTPTTAPPTGTITVIKLVSNTHGGTLTSADFSIHVKDASGDDVTGSPQAGSATGTAYVLSPGTYHVSEGALAQGYVQVSIVCDNNATASFTISAAGETHTCTITNSDIGLSISTPTPTSTTPTPTPSPVIVPSVPTPTPTPVIVPSVPTPTPTTVVSPPTGMVTVIKHVSNTHGGTLAAGNFTVHVMNSADMDVAGSPRAGSETGTAYSLSPGTYHVSEGPMPTGYAQLSVVCDGNATATFTVTGAGDTHTCTLTNTDTAGPVPGVIPSPTTTGISSPPAPPLPPTGVFSPPLPPSAVAPGVTAAPAPPVTGNSTAATTASDSPLVPLGTSAAVIGLAAFALAWRRRKS